MPATGRASFRHSNEVRSGGLPRHFLSLDVARFLAACWVMLYHFSWHSWHAPDTTYGIRAAVGTEVSFPILGSLSRWGYLGVEVFFLISGFIIAVTAAGRTPGQFLSARIVRLAPALWTFTLLVGLVTLLYANAPIEQTAAMFWRSMLLFPTGPWLDGVLWTLTVEVVFYLLILLVLVFGRFHLLERMTWGWVSLSAAGLFLAVLARGGLSLPAPLSDLAAFVQSYGSRPLLVSTGPHFALGILLYTMLNDGVTTRRIAFGLLAFAAAMASAWLTTGALVGTAVWAGAVLLMAAALVAEARRGASRGGTAKVGIVVRVVRLLGLAAYPIYLIHNIAGSWLLGRLVDLGATQIAALWISVATCIAVACAFAALLEPPLQRGLRSVLAAVGLGRRVAPSGGRL